MQLSIVIPCLNEHETIETVVAKAVRGLADASIRGEVLVADNGSTDGSQALAEGAGARVVAVSERGYGNALQGGIEAAQGAWIIMGDADDSYDFLEVPKFVAAIADDDADLIMGCRLPSGGGKVAPGAMPWSHRWIGNPMFSLMARWMFRYPGHDVYCGLRAFRRELVDELNLRSPGMEFAVEMVLKASAFGKRIREVPITLHKDGRKLARPHLRTVRDGWRTLRLFLAFGPKWLFFFPAVFLALLGTLGYALALPSLSIGGATFDVHTLLVSSLSLMLGMQLLIFAISAQIAAGAQGLVPKGRDVDRLLDRLPLEKVLAWSGVAGLLGFGGIVWLFVSWSAAGFGTLPYRETLKQLIPFVTLAALGVQAFMGGFFLSAMRSWRDRE
jgi:glycosyltransferase involved in cell wall biosynthesis